MLESIPLFAFAAGLPPHDRCFSLLSARVWDDWRPPWFERTWRPHNELGVGRLLFDIDIHGKKTWNILWVYAHPLYNYMEHPQLDKWVVMTNKPLPKRQKNSLEGSSAWSLRPCWAMCFQATTWPMKTSRLGWGWDGRFEVQRRFEDSLRSVEELVNPWISSSKSGIEIEFGDISIHLDTSRYMIHLMYLIHQQREAAGRCCPGPFRIAVPKRGGPIGHWDDPRLAEGAMEHWSSRIWLWLR